VVVVERKLQATGALALAAIAAAAAGGGASATTGSRADFELGFSTRAAAAATDVRLHLVYKAAGDPDAKPSPIRKVVVAAPEGTTFHVDAVPVCGASDEQLRAEGSGACPAGSRVGGGKLTAITGVGPPADPVHADIALFNAGDSLLEVVTAEGTDRVLGTDRLAIHGSTLTGNPPSTPGGPPDGETAIRQIDFTVERASGFVTTPGGCSGVWTSTGTFGFADGAEETLRSTAACDKPGGGGGDGGGGGAHPRGARLALSPRHARTGRPTRFVARVAGAPASCTRGVTVRVGGRRVRTGARGRARLTVTVRRAGAHRATAKKRGCGTLGAAFAGR
jgi:hypothetical protein